ncbi:hypothetical protein LDO52_16140 (plasmid) [Acinetobacter pseudolwoffii]|uniref:hypothetical protein n=1 Tax=Acinetobacter TaxID=469 RepID=UPI0015D3B518|nr:MULTISPECIES: hypothetical protein [Acinetobacter]UBX54142.1 hypothetical protein LDO52_16140 [Acinetobacter pseudolwoffii]
MKLKTFLLVVLGAFTVGCAPANDVSYDSPPPQSYSPAKEKYMKTCIGSSEESSCSCMFDAMDPILSKSIGEDWASVGIKDEDFDTYASALEVANQKCF